MKKMNTLLLRQMLLLLRIATLLKREF